MGPRKVASSYITLSDYNTVTLVSSKSLHFITRQDWTILGSLTFDYKYDYGKKTKGLLTEYNSQNVQMSVPMSRTQ